MKHVRTHHGLQIVLDGETIYVRVRKEPNRGRLCYSVTGPERIVVAEHRAEVQRTAPVGARYKVRR